MPEMQVAGERTHSPLAQRKTLAFDPLTGTPVKKLSIAQYLPSSGGWGDVDFDSIGKGLGGRETALIHLGMKWAGMGHLVRCFVPVESPQRKDIGEGRIEFLPLKTAEVYLTSTYHDVVLAWERPSIFDPDVVANCGVSIVGMQVAHLDDMTEEHAAAVDRYVVLSPWAGEFLALQNDGVDFDKIWVVPNGVDLNRYPESEIDFSLDGPRRERGKFFYSSSPDRGLHHLLRLWPKIREQIPWAELYVAYGATRWTSQMKYAHVQQGEVALDIEYGLKQEGVFDVGVLGQQELAQIQKEATALLYTCDTMQPTETGCITVTEAMAAGAPAIITSCDCLPSEYGHAAEVVDLPLNDDHYVKALMRVLHDPARYSELQIAGREEAERRSWDNTATAWLRVINVAMEEKSL